MPLTRTCGPRICHVSDVRADDIPLIEHPGFAEHHYSSLVRREGMFPAHCQLFWSPEAMKRYSIWSVDFAKEDCLKGLKNCGLLWVHDKSDRFVPLFTPKPMAQGGSSPGNVVWTHGNSYASNDNFRRLLQFMDEAGLAYDPPLPKPLNSAQLPDLSGLYEVVGVATPTPGRITGLPNNDLVKVQTANAVPNKFDRPTIGTLIDDQVRLVETDKLRPGAVETFRNGQYVTVETTESVSLFRKFGGGPNQAKLYGGFASTIQNAGRQETAVYPAWSNSRFEAELVVPEGQKVNIGAVGQQPPGSLTPKYRGGADQVLLPRTWSTDWVKSVRDGKTGIVYTLDEFKAAFPDQVTRGN